MKSEIMDSVVVDSTTMVNYYNQYKKQFVYPRKVNVREILVDTEDKALNLLERIKKGEDFSALAKKYSLRKWAANRGGELGYGSLSQYGIHGKKISTMKGGEIGGPFKTDSYYSIIQVIDCLPPRQKTYVEAKYEIEKQLIDGKKRAVLLETIQRFKKDLDIEYSLKGK
jgi:parvulin-like peptidyl-prolyl isomerase